MSGLHSFWWVTQHKEEWVKISTKAKSNQTIISVGTEITNICHYIEIKIWRKTLTQLHGQITIKRDGKKLTTEINCDFESLVCSMVQFIHESDGAIRTAGFRFSVVSTSIMPPTQQKFLFNKWVLVTDARACLRVILTMSHLSCMLLINFDPKLNLIVWKLPLKSVKPNTKFRLKKDFCP